MSTEHYGLREPITSIRLEKGPRHHRLSVWVEGALAGVLTLDEGDAERIAYMFADMDRVRAHTSWGGDEVGCRVTCDSGLRDDLVLVDEYGEITTVGEVRARAGKGRVP